MKELNELSYQIIGCIYKVHSELGPGLLESTYEACLAYELSEAGLFVERQCPLPVIYKEIKLDAGYRIDMIVNKKIILEIKSVEYTAPIHKAQLMTYLKLSSFKLGLLINFNVQDMKKGIDRIVM
jgi:GxxExxY protein